MGERRRDVKSKRDCQVGKGEDTGGGTGQSDGDCAPFLLRTQVGAPIRFESWRVGGRAPDLVASVNGGLETGFLALKIGRTSRTSLAVVR